MIADRPLQLSVPTPLLGVPIAVNIDAQTSDDIKVYYGLELTDVAILDSDYSMSIAGDFKSFTITPLAGLITKAAALPILIAFDPPILQTWDIPNSPRFPEGELEKALDRLTLFTRRIQERIAGIMQERGGVWDGQGLILRSLADGEDVTDAATLGQMQTLIGQIASGAFPNNALLVSYTGDAAGANVAAALNGLATGLEALSAIVDDLTGGFLEGGLLTGAIDLAAWVAVDSAATTNLGAVNSNRVQINGAVTITSFGPAANKYRVVLHNGAHQMTAGASLIPPAAATRVAAAGDVSVWASDDTAVWRCLGYLRASGRPITALVADISDMSANARSFSQAANYAAMRTALGIGALGLLDFDGLVFAGSLNSNTSFPIGTVVGSEVASIADRNESRVLRLNTGDDGRYADSGVGAALAGTWRCRGTVSIGSTDWQMFQRTG